MLLRIKSGRCRMWLPAIMLLLILILPASILHAGEIRDLRAWFDREEQKGGEWYQNYNNECGYLAFREAYLLQAYLIMYETYRDTDYLDKFVQHADSVLAMRDNIRQVTDYRGLSLPAWRHSDPPDDLNPLILRGEYYHVIIDTGNISYPYAWFAQIVKDDPALASYQEEAAEYLQAAVAAVGVHDDEWQDAGETGYYIYRKGSPYWCDGVGVPFNQNLAIARTMLKIYQVTGEAKYLDRVVKISRHFKERLTLDSDRYVWPYWWGYGFYGWSSDEQVSLNTASYQGYKKYEDFRHGALDADFVVLAYQAGIIFSEADMLRFGNTIVKNLLRDDGNINEFVVGSSGKFLSPDNYKILIALWLRCYQFAPSLLPAACEQAMPHEKLGASGLLAVAYLNWACHMHDQNIPSSPSNNLFEPTNI